MSDPALSPIYDRLNGVGGYHPFTANTFADWSSEAGDTVTISRKGTDYAAPVHKQTITWRGQQRVTMETGGNLEREPTERVSDRKFKSTKSAARTNSGKTHNFEVNDQYFLYEIDNPTTGIKTRLQVAENDITAEVTRATTAEGGIRTDVSSLQVTIDGITQTVGTIEDDVDTLEGKVTTIEGSALWTQRDNITGVVGEFDVVTDAQTGTKTLVVKSGGGLNIRRNGAEFGVYDDGTLTAGVIATKVNGVTSTNIYGSNIVMSSTDNTPVNVVINGKVTAEDISATFVQARISDISILSANALSVAGGINGSGTLTVANLATFNGSVRLGSGNSFNKCIVSATINSTTNTLTLVDSNGDAVNFSKAASITLDGNWSGTTYTVTANAGSTVVDTISTSVSLDLTGSANVIGASVKNGSTTLDSKGAQLTENVSDKKVYCTLTGGSQTTIGQVSTQSTYNAGWDYGITQRYVSAETAGSSEIPTKTLAYDEKWKVIFGIPNSSGVDQFSSYVVKAPSSVQPATVDVVAGNWITALYPSTGRASITLSPSSGGGESRTVVITSGSMNGTTDGYVEICAIAAVDDATLLPVRSYQARITFDAWSNNKATVHLKTHSGTGSSMCSREIDATSIYLNGLNVGINQGAAGVTVSGSWTGNTYKASASNGNNVSVSLTASTSSSEPGGGSSVTINTYNASTHIGWGWVNATSADSGSNKGITYKFKADATSVYNAGWNAAIDAMGLYQTGGTYYFYKYAESTYLYPGPMTPSGQGQWYNIAAGYGTISKK